jgi:hypothetical protein
MASLAVVASTLMWPRATASQTFSEMRDVLVVTQEGHLGQGADLSPDGARMVYVGADRALHIMVVTSREDHILLKQVAPGLDVFDDPVFSPDGTRLAFCASGGTQYYPFDIYSIKIDGTGLRRLTVSALSGGNGRPLEYYYKPQYSPDGSQILTWHHNPSESQPDSADLVSSEGTRRLHVSDGRPLSWSADGNAIFIARNNDVVRINLLTGIGSAVFRLHEPIFGRLPAEDVFAVAEDTNNVGLATVQGASATAPAAVRLPIRKRRDGSAAAGDVKDLTLKSMHFDRAAKRLLLHYRDDFWTTHTLEVVDIQ